MVFDLVARNNGRNNLMTNWFNSGFDTHKKWTSTDNISKRISDFLGSNIDDFTLSFGNSKEFNVDVTESDVGYELSADLPGISKDGIDIKLEDGVLHISCERNSTTEKNGQNFRLKERQYGKCSRSFALPDVDEDSIEANLTNGVLTIKMMKKTKNEKKKIKIKVN